MDEPTEVTLIDINVHLYSRYMLQEFTHCTHCVAIRAYFYVTLGGKVQNITILHRGGSVRFITILHREGGVYGEPQNVLRNI